MANDVLTLSTTKLIAGDSIVINSPDTTPTKSITIDIVSEDRQNQEALDTDGTVPISDRAARSVANLSQALLESQFVANVETEGTILIISFVDESEFSFSDLTAVTINDGNGSLINKTKFVGGTTGNVIIGDPVLVDNITITDIQHSIGGYGYASKGAPYGNIGSQINTTVFFTTADTFVNLTYKFGWDNNSNQIYNTLDSFKIDESKFESRYTGVSQSFNGSIGALSPNTPISWQTGNSAVFDLGSNNYQLVHTQVVPYLITPEDVDSSNQYQPPEELKGSESVRYLLEINLRQDLLDINPSETTSRQDLTNFLGGGNIGTFDQVFKTGSKLYQLESLIFDNADDEISFVRSTAGTAIISPAVSGSDFLDTSTITVVIQEIKDDIDNTLTYTSNVNYDRVQVTCDGSVGSGNVLTGVSATQTLGVATVEFTVLSDKIDGDYAIYFECAFDPVLTVSAQNVLGRLGTANTNADTDVIIFEEYPDTNYDEFLINYHYDDTEQNAFNQVRAFVEDIMLSRWRVRNLDPNNTNISSFTLSIRERNGNTLETFNIPNENLPYSKQRIFELADSSIRDEINGEIYFDLDDTGMLFDFTDVDSTWNRFGAGNLYLVSTSPRTGAWDNDQAVPDTDLMNDGAGGTFNVPINSPNGVSTVILYNSSSNQILSQQNLNAYYGLYSIDKYESYGVDGLMTSTEPDNDCIAFVIAFTIDDDGIEHTLSLVATTGGIVLDLNPTFDGTTNTSTFGGANNPLGWALVYNFGKRDCKQLVYYETGSATGLNWQDVGDFNFEVIRNQDDITINGSWEGFVNMIDYNLNDNNETLVFKGNQFIGFGFMSQSQGGFNDVRLRLGQEDWLFKYPFQIWKDWINRTDVSLFCGVNCVQNLSNGQQVNFTKEFVSPVFELGDYDETKSGDADPQALRTPSSMQFFNNVTGDEVGVILNDVPTRVVATFEDNNLNDLESNVSPFPFTMTTGNTVDGTLTGYFGITTNNNLQSEYLRFHNFRENPTDTLWSEITGGEVNYATLTIQDIKTATLEAVIDPVKLIEKFGNNFNCLNITARLDKFQINS